MIGLISINYKHAPVEVRERFDFSELQKLEFHQILRNNHDVEGLMILSTCNRTEIYFEYENHIGQESKIMHGILKALVDYKSFFESLSPFINKKTGIDVSKHLFRLVSGLESMIVGEYQIVEQIKDAFSFAKENNMLGPIISRMVQKSFEAGKYIRTNTLIDKGAVSVSYAAVEKISRIFDLKNSSVLAVGAGETSILTIQYLQKKEIKKLAITNRSIEKAKEIANKYSLETKDFKGLHNHLNDFDVAIFSTSAKEELLSFDLVSQKMQERNYSPLLLVDLCVPRNLPNSISEIEGVELINIDGLKDLVNENYTKRKSQISKAEEFIDFFLLEFDEWTTSRQLRPSIISLNDQFNTLLNFEQEGLDNADEGKNFSDQHSRIKKKFLSNLIKKIKNVSDNGRDEEVLEVINKIFIDER
jgi:glutamyl-tRNA reductase